MDIQVIRKLMRDILAQRQRVGFFDANPHLDVDCVCYSWQSGGQEGNPRGNPIILSREPDSII
jgi:hypothetical protein